MKSWLCAVACLISFAITSHAQNAPPAAEAFGTLPTISDPSLSPDGKYLALIQAYKGRPVATIWQVDSLSTPPVIIPFDEGFIVRVQ